MKKLDLLIEEYKLLTAHYFHEDNFYLAINSIFLSINAAILAYIQSDFYAHNGLGLDWTFPLIGIFLSMSWLFSLLRVRNLRKTVENRIEEIERDLNFIFMDDEPEIDFLRVRYQRKLHSPFTAKLPATLLFLAIPLAFLVVWLFLLLG